MIDLSGKPPRWPTALEDLFGDCLRRAAGRSALWREPAPQGDELLREMIGARLALDPDQLTITASLRAAVLTYARGHRYFRLERPTYPGVADVVRAAGAEVTFHDRAELLAGGHDGLLWLTAPGRNPDGADLTDADHARIEQLAAAGQRVVVNGTYAWFAGEHRWPAGADVAGSLHKLRGVGARIGWVHSASYFDEAFAEMLGTTGSRVWQHAWGMFLRDGGYDGLYRTVIAPAVEAADAFGARLREHGLPAPCGSGVNRLLWLRPDIDEARALQALESRGLRLCAGAPFQPDGPALRISFAGIDRADAQRCADAVAALSLLAAEPVRVAR